MTGTWMTAEEMARARALLEDDASYKEVARTLGRDQATIANHLPGFGWTSSQAGQLSAAIRKFEKMTDRSAL